MEPIQDSTPIESMPPPGLPPGGPVPPRGTVQEGGSRPPDFDERLAALCQDGGIWRFAMRLAGNRELAEDAIQEVYWALAKTADPAGIDDLRRYFCRALQHMVRGLLRQCSTGPAPTGDVDAVEAAQAGGSRRSATRSSPCEESGVRMAQASAWLSLLKAASLSVSERSDDPQRYQAVIVAASCWKLHALMDGGVSTADINSLLIGQYPEYFAPTRSRDNSYHQRLSRGRHDVRDLLASVIDRDELRP